MKKLNGKNIFFIVAVGCLFFSGVAAMIYPTISNIYSMMNSRTAISGYQQEVAKMDNSEIDGIFEKADKFNYDVSRRIYNDGYERCLCNADGLMCYVDIPTIGVYLPVYYGTTDDVLAKGAGYLLNTSLPVGGAATHSVISAHTGLPSADMFTKLDQVRIDDVFYIHVLDRVLAYKVDKIKVVYPDVVSDLEIKKDKDYLTLLTCTPYGVNDKRLLVRGVRVEYDPDPKEPDETSDALPTQDDVDKDLRKEINQQLYFVTGVAAGAVIIYLAAVLWLVRTIRRTLPDPQEKPE